VTGEIGKGREQDDHSGKKQKKNKKKIGKIHIIQRVGGVAIQGQNMY